ncbi:MAG: RES family NAD+ phosphorylase [Gammaproteobacteria bacterium]
MTSVWRIATASRAYGAADLTGEGAALNPGRWNESGVGLVYTAENRSLAVLETLAAIPAMTLPLNRFLVRIDVPEAAWRERQVLEPDEARERLPTWDAIPPASESARYGTGWCRSMRSVLLCVPSVVVPEEQVVLINPGLIEANGIRAQVVRRFDYAAAARRAV